MRRHVLSALLIILATASEELHPSDDRSLRSRGESREDALIHQRAVQAPVALRKMRPGEMFFSHYWQFDLENATRSTALAGETITNATLSADLLPPLHLHSDDAWKSPAKIRHWPRSLFGKRDYQCPAGTQSCATIGRPNSCCGTDENCIHVTDTGSGDVGCCPKDATCGGSTIAACNTAEQFTACPDSSNGGCCIPGYTCDSIGCVASGTTTITASGSTVVVVAGSTSVVTASTTTIAPIPASATTVTQVSTLTITPSTSSPQASTFYSTITTPTSTVTISPSISTATALSVITITASPAVLATSNSQASAISISTTTVSLSSSIASGSCPIGYWQCSGYYQGCCQIGYGCLTSSCLSAPSSATVLTGSGVTVIVVTGSGVTTITNGLSSTTVSSSSTSGGTVVTTGSATSTSTAAAISTTYTGGGFCATGWYSCDASNGGGCCPSGYSCAASCIATQTGEPGRVYKVAPSNSANSLRNGHMILLMSAVVISAYRGLL